MVCLWMRRWVWTPESKRLISDMFLLLEYPG